MTLKETHTQGEPGGGAAGSGAEGAHSRRSRRAESAAMAAKLLSDPRPMLRRMRYKVLGISLAIVLAAVSVITLSTLPAWPIIGVAVASMVVVINTVANRLQQPICHGCGESLAAAKFGTHGTICPQCGSINQPVLGAAGTPSDDESSRRA